MQGNGCTHSRTGRQWVSEVPAGSGGHPSCIWRLALAGSRVFFSRRPPVGQRAFTWCQKCSRRAKEQLQGLWKSPQVTFTTMSPSEQVTKPAQIKRDGEIASTSGWKEQCGNTWWNGRFVAVKSFASPATHVNRPSFLRSPPKGLCFPLGP